MIKPTQKIAFLCMSLLTLLAGQTAELLPQQFLFAFAEDIKWAQIHDLLQSNLFPFFMRFKDQVRMRKISLQNHKVSMSYLKVALEMQGQDLQSALVETLQSIIQPMQLYLKESYQPSYLKGKKKRSMTSSSVCINDIEVEEIPEPFNGPMVVREKRSTIQSGMYPPSDRKISVYSQRSNSSSQSIKKDLQSRIMQAQQMKVSRLDKILGLKVKKPVVDSGIRKKSIEKRDSKWALADEIAKNKEEIKAIQRKEVEFRWKIERETKQMQKLSERQRMYDDIARYQETFNKKHQLENMCAGRQSLIKNSSWRNSERYQNKSETMDCMGSFIQEEQLKDLVHEAQNSRRERAAFEERVLKGLNK